MLAQRFCLIFVAVNLILRTAQCSHILGFAQMNYISHHRQLLKLGKELQARGHRYTHILPNFAKEKYDDVEVKVLNSRLTSEELTSFFFNLTELGNLGFTAVPRIFTILLPEYERMGRQVCEDLLTNQSLISELHETVDLVLCDVTNDCCYIVADVLNATRVDVSPPGFISIIGVYLFDYAQAPVYATIEESLLSPNKFSFVNRLKGFLTSIAFWHTYARPKFADLWEKHAKATTQFESAAIARRTHSIGLIPHDFALDLSRPLGANIKVIGALSPEPARSLPTYLDEFMSENEAVVVVSLGTNLENYPTGLAQSIADELCRVPAGVLWRYNGTLVKNLCKNIKIIPWFSRNECTFNDILGHDSTKVFVTHGGLNSYQESVYHGVPMVVIPMAVDQPRQASLVQYKKLGVAIEWKSVKPGGDMLKNAIVQVLSNQDYTDNTKRLSTIMRDRKRSPSEEGADWIEYALRHHGARHLTSVAMDLLPQYQLHMFDVFLFLVFVSCLVVYGLLRFCLGAALTFRRKMIVKEKRS